MRQAERDRGAGCGGRPVKQRDRGFGAGELLTGIAAAQLAGEDFLVGLDRQRVCAPDGLGDAAARAVLVTALAAAADDGRTVRSIALGCQARYRTTGYGQLAGHPVTITTTGAET